MPVIELAKAVADMAVGEEIVVIADDPGAKVDIPVWCRMKRHELVAVERGRRGLPVHGAQAPTEQQKREPRGAPFVSVASG